MADYALDSLNPTVNTTVGDIQRLPLFDFKTIKDSYKVIIMRLVTQNIHIKRHLLQYSLIEEEYKQSPIVNSDDVAIGIILYYNKENALQTQILLNESIINKTVFEVYELSEHDKQMVLEKEGIPVGDLPVSHEAKVAYKQWLMLESEFKPTNDVLEHLEYLEERDDLPKITDFDTLYQNNNEWEEFCKIGRAHV